MHWKLKSRHDANFVVTGDQWRQSWPHDNFQCVLSGYTMRLYVLFYTFGVGLYTVRLKSITYTFYKFVMLWVNQVSEIFLNKSETSPDWKFST